MPREANHFDGDDSTTIATMTTANTSAQQFQQILRYLEQLGLDPAPVAASARLDAAAIRSMHPDTLLPTYDYAALYQQAANTLQQRHPGVVWGAGMGTDAFQFRCHVMICCNDLGSALTRATQYDRLLQPLTGYGVKYRPDGDRFWVGYHVDVAMNAHLLQPETPTTHDGAESSVAVAKASGLRIWYTLIGWMIGRNPQVLAAQLSSSALPADVKSRLEHLFQVPIAFGAEESAICIPARYLDHRIVQTPRSLDAFLEDAVYNLILQDNQRLNISAAVKSLLTRDMPDRAPTLDMIANQVHMSSSNLRRRLQQEGTSYQKIKDQIRRDMAYRHLREGHLKVHQIAEILGFNEPSSFIRSFRNWSGLTPRQFREQISKPPPTPGSQHTSCRG